MALRYELLGYQPERYLKYAKSRLLLLKKRRQQSGRHTARQNILVTDNSRIYLQAGPTDLIRIIGAAAPAGPPLAYFEDGQPKLFRLRRVPDGDNWDWREGYLTNIELSSVAGDAIIPVYEPALSAGLLTQTSADLSLTLEDKLAIANTLFDKKLGYTLDLFLVRHLDAVIQDVPIGNTVLNQFVQGGVEQLYVFREAGELYLVYRVNPSEEDNVLPDAGEDGSFEQRAGVHHIEYVYPGIIGYEYTEGAVSRKGSAYGIVWMATLRELLSAPWSSTDGITVDVATTSDTFEVAITYGPVSTTITITDLTVPTDEGANNGLWVSGGTATRVDANTVRVIAQVQIRWYVWNGTVGLEWSDPKSGHLMQAHVMHDTRALWQISSLDKVNFGSGTAGVWMADTEVFFYENEPPPGAGFRRTCENLDSASEQYIFNANDAAGSVLNPLFCERRESSRGDGFNYLYSRYGLVERFALTFDINGPIKEVESGYPGDSYSYTGFSNISDYEYTYVPLGEINYSLFAWEHGAKVAGAWTATLEAGDSSTPVGDISRAFNNGYVQVTQVGGEDNAVGSHDRTKSSVIYDNASELWRFYYKDLELLSFSANKDISDRLLWWNGSLIFPVWANEWNHVTGVSELGSHPGNGRNPGPVTGVPGYSSLDDCNRYCGWWAGAPSSPCPGAPDLGSNTHVGTGIVGIGAPDEPTAVQLDLPVVSYFSDGLACAYWKNAQGSVDGICYALLSGDFVTKREDYYEQLYRYRDSSDPAYQDDAALASARAALDAVQTVLVNNFANQLIIDNLSPGKVLVVLK